MKKIIINENQNEEIKKLKKASLNVPLLLIDEIKNNDTPFSNNSAFIEGSLEELVNLGYLSSISEFKDNIEDKKDSVVINELNRLLAKTISLEEPIREELEKLCLNAIIDFFKVPEDAVELSANLVPSIDSNLSFRISPSGIKNSDYESVSEIKEIKEEIEKRNIINAITVGAADAFSKKMLKSIIGDIFELDENLPKLYSKIMKINNYLIFKTSVNVDDNNHSQGGFVKTIISEDKPTKIEGTALILPMLIYEMAKGCIELFVSNGLPDDRFKINAVIENSDVLKNDPWNMRIGGELWKTIESSCIDCGWPTFFDKLSEIPTSEFLLKMKDVISGTKAGKEFIKELSLEAKKEDDYDSFDYDMLQKQEKSIIADDYFSDEEIKQWKSE